MIASYRLGILFFLLSLFLAAPAAMAKDASVVRRAALDIGSANIKCTVADVDVDSGAILEVLEEYTFKVDFAEDMARSYDGNFSNEIMTEGRKALEEIKARALAAGVEAFSAVGGGIFREARNGRAYFTTLKSEVGIPCRIMSKQQAALLTYHAVRLQKPVPEANLLVWDVGGSTQTMTARTLDGGLEFYIDKMASVSFKNAVVSSIQGKDISATDSPNPMSATDVHRALDFVETHALINVNPALASRLRGGTMTVVGIGGVHYYAVPELLGERAPTYSRQEVKAALERWIGKEDAAFKSEFAATRLTNLILILGYMNALDIANVAPLNVNQTDGLLVSPEFW